jgi:hypothetical protein
VVPRVENVRVWLVVAACLLSSACRRPDPQKELDLSQLEAYWVVDSPVGSEQYLAPAVRLVLKNKGQAPARALEATAVFRREGDGDKTWGSDWQRVAPGGKPLQPGQDTVVVMKSDARYHTNGPAESMFQHELWKDTSVTVFVRLGSSPWTKLGDLPVERRIGSRTVAPEVR